MSFTQKQLVLAKMVANGQNEKEAKTKVIKHFDSATRCYKDANVKQLAEIITEFAIND